MLVVCNNLITVIPQQTDVVPNNMTVIVSNNIFFVKAASRISDLVGVQT